MQPNCPKCESKSTRRRKRDGSFGHRFMHFFGRYPWECVDCQERFFSSQRFSRVKRNPLGEVYTGPDKKQTLGPGAEEVHNP